MLFRNLVPLAAGFSAVLWIATPAHAAHDMSGKWIVVPNGFHMNVTQSDGHVSDSETYMSGTIDEETGHFQMFISGGVPPMAIGLDGDVAADGKSFSATYTHSWCTGGTPHTVQCFSESNAVTGTRCGNGELGEDEECDDNNAHNGDCCSSSCQIDSAGTSCTADEDPCTVDACDADAACTHTFSTGPCSEPHGCGIGDCSTGSCVVTDPTPAGTSCDLDTSVCTPDACDGTGACAAAEPIDCSPCAECSATEGCIAPENNWLYGCSGGERATLRLRTDERSTKHRLTLKFKTLLGIDYIGDPTLDTSYTACIYSWDGEFNRPLVTATVSPAGTCSGAACWEAGETGYGYKDELGSAYGVNKFVIDTDKGFQVKAKGEGIGLPLSLPSTELELTAKIVEGSDVYGPCWQAPLQTDDQSTTKYKGSHREE